MRKLIILSLLLELLILIKLKFKMVGLERLEVLKVELYKFNCSAGNKNSFSINLVNSIISKDIFRMLWRPIRKLTSLSSNFNLTSKPSRLIILE